MVIIQLPEFENRFFIQIAEPGGLNPKYLAEDYLITDLTKLSLGDGYDYQSQAHLKATIYRKALSSMSPAYSSIGWYVWLGLRQNYLHTDLVIRHSTYDFKVRRTRGYFSSKQFAQLVIEKYQNIFNQWENA